jgi:hypothetical protein
MSFLRTYKDANDMYWTYEHVSPYMIEVIGYVNIEDALDVTYTYDELKEHIGRQAAQRVHGTNLEIATFQIYDQDLIGQAVRALIAEIPKGKKSIRIEDADLLEAMKANDYYTASHYAQRPVRRTGDRLSLHEPKVKKGPNKNDARKFINMFFFALSQTLGKGVVAELKVDQTSDARLHAYNFIKSMWKWEDVEKMCRDLSGPWRKWSEDDITLFKAIYENPEKFC